MESLLKKEREQEAKIQDEIAVGLNAFTEKRRAEEEKLLSVEDKVEKVKTFVPGTVKRRKKTHGISVTPKINSSSGSGSQNISEEKPKKTGDISLSSSVADDTKETPLKNPDVEVEKKDTPSNSSLLGVDYSDSD